MRIAIGNDHAGVAEKRALEEKLQALGHEVRNVGTDTEESCDYPEFAHAVARTVASGEADLGVLVCGTGIGVSMAANKIPGIRAAVSHTKETAHLCREHNDANVLCVGARVCSLDSILEQVEEFVSTPFAGGRHQRRVDMIEPS